MAEEEIWQRNRQELEEEDLRSDEEAPPFPEIDELVRMVVREEE